MLRPIDTYFSEHSEDINSCLQFLREYILKHDDNMSEACKYGMPFYFYKNKRCCYLWVHKKHKQPYIGIVDGSLVHHPQLIQENRVKMKILLINPNEDIPIDIIDSVLKQMLSIYQNNSVK